MTVVGEGTAVRSAVTVVLGVLLLCGCGTSTGRSDADPVGSPYDGPARAGKALECDGKPYAHGSGDYGGGLEEVQDDADAALEDYVDSEGWDGRWPDDGYRVEREAVDRVLLSWDVDQRTKVAFVVADGIKDYLGHRGWGVETWAQCDPAELSADEIAAGVCRSGRTATATASRRRRSSRSPAPSTATGRTSRS